ncbi:hypothetical protein JH06_0100 [Blastocystis sp. subtype 4]|uniref:hypothetical protein n=1 Tax=Blastocystis sp. subtype 4 TaxID=944170 RepID=UPI000711EF71|nr:hypothetical protein JH06_0100 [Blastocystis sp. subtype 4]KNB46494.1 hypothetical protein JH06_0100 [Blastocystis sp. subtype 4]|eukprot:XP_014529937.1 hypothetical protein JH06_0100 [Blastocystis sp. subtype 4]
MILKHIDGYASTGEMTAILGARLHYNFSLIPSGAGKTTLLSILCGRNSNFTGQFSINGREVGASSLRSFQSFLITNRKVCRFVRQHDLFYEFLTVQEHLYYQAILRLGDKGEQQIRDRLVWLVKHFNLSKCLHVTIGGSHTKGISGGEMRRVTLATELINYPSILFCDEPTSGLDSYMAETVIKTLRILADNGVTVICTIHQPPTETYALFDRVMYLADGEVAYFGKREDALEYFESIGMPCPPYYNMADFAIHTMAIDNELEDEQKAARIQEVHQLCETFKKSEMNQKNIEIADHIPLSCEDQSIIDEIDSIEFFEKRNIVYKFWKSMFGHSYPTSWWVQFRTLTSRCFTVLMRDSRLTVARFIQTVVLSTLIGLVFIQLSFSQSGITNRISVIFFVMMTECFSLLFSEIQVFPFELPIVYNEVASGLYRIDAYYLAKTIVGLPMSLIFPIIGASINYCIIGLDPAPQRFFAYIGILLLVTNATVALGHFISALTGDFVLANAISAMLLLPFVLLGGFYLQDQSVPPYLIWLKETSMFNWGFKLMIIDQFKGKTFECPPAPAACAFPNGEAVMAYTKVSMADIPLGISILVTINIVWRVAALVCLEIHAYRHLSKI